MSDYIEIEYRSGKLEYITNSLNATITPEDWVIVEVERGLDIAQVIHSSYAFEDENFKIDEEKSAKLIRVATQEDIDTLESLQEKEAEANEKFKAAVVKYPFEMKLIDAVYQFDKNKITFFFTADGRVDFREFVRELASTFKTRIELHQISGRDVARKLGGIGMCGCRYCCTSFLKRFSQITIKMVKDQNLSGNLSKISGPCGRLLCCLDYEQDFYQETAKEFPEVGDELIINKTKMIVSKNDYYNKKITLVSADDSIEMITLDDFLKIQSNQNCKNCGGKNHKSDSQINPRNSGNNKNDSENDDDYKTTKKRAETNKPERNNSNTTDDGIKE
ncbi:MAG: regulatory iron-sulfur-containing complex subunit RicT [Candidatus Cloacimonetes bacterium]|nr:regulatory iron-sulfur-containing complex subunit RicT [Candidatus Cloacimonadota bacterium]